MGLVPPPFKAWLLNGSERATFGSERATFIKVRSDSVTPSTFIRLFPGNRYISIYGLSIVLFKMLSRPLSFHVTIFQGEKPQKWINGNRYTREPLHNGLETLHSVCFLDRKLTAIVNFNFNSISISIIYWDRNTDIMFSHLLITTKIKCIITVRYHSHGKIKKE